MKVEGKLAILTVEHDFSRFARGDALVRRAGGLIYSRLRPPQSCNIYQVLPCADLDDVTLSQYEVADAISTAIPVKDNFNLKKKLKEKNH